ncbi:hypothetical protein BN129_1110 [Cronobacter sakazakii 701]|nr:hypothetical protein BN129_1110 [Cronobacter sakazakii 701]
MSRVAHFIGIDADKAWLDALVPGQIVLLLKRWLLAETRDHLRQQQLQERTAAPELHFEEQALGFMDSGRARQRHRLARPFARQVLLITGMAGFVDHAKQRAEEFIFVIAGGDAHIFRHAAAERVRADIQPAAVEIKAEKAHRLKAQLALLRHRERPLRRNQRGALLFLHRAGEEIRQPAAQIAKQRIETRAGHVRLENIEQGVIARTAFGFGANSGLFTAQLHHLFEIFREAVPVVGRTLAAPGVFAAAARERFRLDQRFRQQRRLLVVALHFAQVRLFEIV